MIQLTVVITNTGEAMIGRKCDVLNHPDRDTQYGSVDLPPFECDRLQTAVLVKGFNREQAELVANYASTLLEPDDPADA